MRNGGQRLWRWEPYLVRLAVVCLFLLVMVQALMLKEGPRLLLSRVDRYEGETISGQIPLYAADPLMVAEKSVVTNRIRSLRESKVLVIRMLKPATVDGAFVVVNGERVGDFRRGDVKVTVYEGDYVEIDVSEVNEQVRFVVNVPSSDLISPIDGIVLEGVRTYLPVGKVKFKP